MSAAAEAGGIGPVVDGPRIAVAPEGTRGWLREAVRSGGGVLVDVPDAEGLVWTDEGDSAGSAAQRLSEVLRFNPHIRWVQLPWAGVEPYAEVLDRDRLWTAGQGVYAPPVAEHALALILAGMRDLKRRALATSWQDQSGISLLGGKVTIFGGGGIAQDLIRLLEPFGCSITVVRRTPDPVEGAQRVLEFGERYEALKGADVVVLALALTPETTGLIGEIELELMEPHAWLVNVARGKHVVTDDLVTALRGDVIGGAALDVTDPEPLPEGHPLWSLPNALITPHTANTEDMAIPLLSARITENVRRFAHGEELLGVIDLDRGY